MNRSIKLIDSKTVTITTTDYVELFEDGYSDESHAVTSQIKYFQSHDKNVSVSLEPRAIPDIVNHCGKVKLSVINSDNSIIDIDTSTAYLRKLAAIKYSESKNYGIGLMYLSSQIPFSKSIEEVTNDIINASPEHFESKRESIQIDISRYLDSHKKTILAKKRLPSGYKTEVRNSYENMAKEVFESKGVYLLKGSMGSGKTTAMKEIAQEFRANNQKSAFVCPRRSITNSVVFEGQNHYEDKIDLFGEMDIEILNICAPSILRHDLKQFFSNTQLIMIDEITQVINFILNDFLDYNDKIYTKLVELIASAEVVVMADADINSDVMRLLEEAKRTDIKVIEVKSDLSGIDAIVSEYDTVYSNLISYVKNGDKCLVATDNIGTQNSLAIKAVQVFQDIKILVVNKETAKNKEVEEWIASPDLHSSKYDLITYSPLISSSLSIEEYKFDRVVVLSKCGSISPQDLIQMSRRSRLAEIVEFGTEERINQIKDTKIELIEQKNKLSSKNYGRSSLVAPEFIAKMNENESDASKMQNNFANNLIWGLQEDGFNVIIRTGDEESSKIGKSLSCSGDQLYKNQREIDLLAANALSESEVKSISSDSETEFDSETHIRLERYNAEKTFATASLDRNSVRLWNRGKIGSVIKRTEALLATKADCKAKMKKQEYRKGSVDLVSVHEFGALIFSTIGVDPASPGSKEITATEARRVIKKLVGRSTEWNALRLQSANKSWLDKSDPIKMLNTILKNFGYKMASVKVTDGGKQVRRYSIDLTHFNTISEILARREKTGVQVVKQADLVDLMAA
jgi:hypothetical protein